MNLSKPTQVDPHVLLGKYADVGIIRQVNLTLVPPLDTCDGSRLRPSF